MHRHSLLALLALLIGWGLAFTAGCSNTTDLGGIDYIGPQGDAGDGRRDDARGGDAGVDVNNGTEDGGGDAGDANDGTNNGADNNGDNNGTSNNGQVFACEDRDHDGVPAGSDCPGPVDCDDLDANRSPMNDEVCDGVDNDCDEAVDEDVVTPSCSFVVGVCAGRHRRCVEGGFPECDAARYGESYVEEETAAWCDGLDNDCDGQTDEQCPCEEGESRGCGTDTGACERGQQACVEGYWGPCLDAVGPTDEVCDGLDNDCDGETDEGLTAPSCALDVGVCAGRLRACGGEAGWLECGPERYGELYVEDEAPATVSGVCDGLDNDCDGQTDEGCACVDTDTRPCGLDVGLCERGVMRCEDGGWGGICEGGVLPADEACDGEDNDCDGDVDEGCPCQQGETRNCGTQTGECTLGTQQCVQGEWSTCSGQAATEEVCDQRDNDCDGYIDDGVTNACGGCEVLAGVPGRSCGQCGIWACDTGTGNVVCNDPGANACGGCGGPVGELGATCGVDGCGTWQCSANTAQLVCLGTTNLCGGCEALPGRPGTPCGTCNSGTWTCDGQGGLSCEGDAGQSVRNACGGCLSLPHVPGTACGTCDSGAWTCDGLNVVACEGDLGHDAYNACGSCGELPAELGSACGEVCRAGRQVCRDGGLVCEGDGPNACGGCSALAGVPGSPCGVCGLGVWACDGEVVVCREPALSPGEVAICAGTFAMGSPAGEVGRDADETRHTVTQTRAFAIRQTELTAAELEVLASEAGIEVGWSTVVCNDCPATGMNWYEAAILANAASELAGLDACYVIDGCTWVDPLTCTGQPDCSAGQICEVTFLGLDCSGFRLPTEAEWELATRAGTTTAFFDPNIVAGDACANPALDRYAWFCGSSRPSPLLPTGVRSRAASPSGLYDVYGNVHEWVWDGYAAFTSAAATDPLGNGQSMHRVLRGGGFDSSSAECRSASRSAARPGTKRVSVGVRFVRTLTP